MHVENLSEQETRNANKPRQQMDLGITKVIT
jgi:hypothetical protein